MPKENNADAKGVIGEVFDEYIAMNEGAIIFSKLYDLIKDRPESETITFGELKSKINEYQEEATGKLANFRRVVDSLKEKF